MNHQFRFGFKRIILKPLEEKDIEYLRGLRNKQRQYFTHQDEISPEQQKQWYDKYLSKDDDIMFAVSKIESPEVFIGAIALYNIDWKKKTAECGRTIIDKTLAPEKGIGTEATTAVCLFGFDTLCIKKIVGEVLKNNERIIKVDTRAGFYITGDKDDNSYTIAMTKKTINLFSKDN